MKLPKTVIFSVLFLFSFMPSAGSLGLGSVGSYTHLNSTQALLTAIILLKLAILKMLGFYNDEIWQILNTFV